MIKCIDNENRKDLQFLRQNPEYPEQEGTKHTRTNTMLNVCCCTDDAKTGTEPTRSIFTLFISMKQKNITASNYEHKKY